MHDPDLLRRMAAGWKSTPIWRSLSRRAAGALLRRTSPAAKKAIQALEEAVDLSRRAVEGISVGTEPGVVPLLEARNERLHRAGVALGRYEIPDFEADSRTYDRLLLHRFAALGRELGSLEARIRSGGHRRDEPSTTSTIGAEAP